MQKPTDNGAQPAAMDRLLLGVHDKNPQDILGDISKSDLPRNVALAAAITFAGLGLLTVGPYVFGRMAAARPAEQAPVAEQTPAKETATAKETPKESARTTSDPLEKPVPDPLTAKPKDPLDKLGVSETKTSDPKKNPLDKGVDDLLKDIK